MNGMRIRANVRRASALRRRLARVFASALFIWVVVAVIAPSANAFTISGGTAEQRACVDRTIKASAFPYATAEAELRAMGPVKVSFVSLDGVSGYSQPGRIFINSSIPPGKALSELAAHEWAHQIWYTLGPKWWQKWAELCKAGAGGEWKTNPGENFAECAKVTYWSEEYLLRPYAVTDLVVTSPDAVRKWLDLARYVNRCPFVDLAPTAMPTDAQQDELAAAGGYVSATGIMPGLTGTVFGPAEPLTKRQLAQICLRANLRFPAVWLYDDGTATRADVRQVLSGASWTAERWDEPATRGQVARLLWRGR